MELFGTMISRISILILSQIVLISSQSMGHPSWGLVVDQDRNIYFADLAHNGMGSVWKLTNRGDLELLLSDFHAHNVSLDRDGSIITAHGEGSHTLVRIQQNGKIDTLYHTLDYKEFFGGNCAWSAKDAKVVYGLREHEYIRELGLDGNQKNVGDYKFKWNQSVYVSPEGTIYATEIGRDNGCIVKIDTLGKASIIAKDLISKLDREKDIHNDILLGITKGCDGNIYVAETAGRRIAKILSDGQNDTFYKSEQGWMPTAIDFFSGDAYILEYRNDSGSLGPRIIKIDEFGEMSVLFNYDAYQKGEILPSTDKNYPFWYIVALLVLALSLTILLRKSRKYTTGKTYK